MFRVSEIKLSVYNFAAWINVRHECLNLNCRQLEFTLLANLVPYESICKGFTKFVPALSEILCPTTRIRRICPHLILANYTSTTSFKIQVFVESLLSIEPVLSRYTNRSPRLRFSRKEETLFLLEESLSLRLYHHESCSTVCNSNRSVTR